MAKKVPFKYNPVKDAMERLPARWSIKVEIHPDSAKVALFHWDLNSETLDEMYDLDATVQDLDNCILECIEWAMDIQAQTRKGVQ